MRKYLYKLALTAAFAGVISLQSCEKWLDINTNELAATEVEPGYLFSGAVTNFSSLRLGGDVFVNMMYAGQFSNDWWWYEGADSYDMGQYPSGNTWVSVYSSTGNNLYKAIQIAEQNGNPNAAAQCKIYFANVVGMATLCFGDIPYTEAWRIDEIKTPKFDAQKDVFNSVINMLDSALAQIDVDNELAITDYDIFYGGDMTKWVKLANSLKLKYLIYMANQDESAKAKIASLVSAGNFLTELDDDFSFPFYDSPGNFNPTYRLFYNFGFGYRAMFMATPNIVDPMVEANDPRLPAYFLDLDKVGYYKGADTGDEYVEIDDPENEGETLLETSVFNNKVLFAPDYPDELLTSVETNLYLAEIYTKGIGVSKDLSTANTYYKQALTDAVSNPRYGITATAGAAWVESMPALTTMTEDEAFEAINNQQRIADIVRPVEGWSNQRRTGIPTLKVPANVESLYPDILHRWVYPDREASVNSNVPLVEGVWTKMWFEK